MARIRTVKLDLWTHEDLSALPIETHVLAAALLNYADDEGYFNAHPKLIQATLFPLRELSSNVPVMLQELSGIGYVRLFAGNDGKQYGHITKFLEHQVVSHPKASKIKLLESSSNVPVIVHDASVPNRRELNGIEGNKIAEASRKEKPAEKWTDHDIAIIVCQSLMFSGLKHPQWVAQAIPQVKKRTGIKGNQQIADFLIERWGIYRDLPIKAKFGFQNWLAEGHYADDYEQLQSADSDYKPAAKLPAAIYREGL